MPQRFRSIAIARNISAPACFFAAGSMPSAMSLRASSRFSPSTLQRHLGIRTERQQLQKASAVLGCLVYSATHDADGIDYDDVARVALDPVVRAVDALDIVQLQRKAGKGRSIQ
jgi:hypothetical protein